VAGPGARRAAPRGCAPVDDSPLLHGAAARQQRERAVHIAQVLSDLPRGVKLSCARA